MNPRQQLSGQIKVSKVMILGVMIVFVIIGVQLFKLAIYEEINGFNLQKFAQNRNTQQEVLVANRGTIYNVQGEPLAQTVNAYTVVAFLDEKRSEGNSRPRHIVDKEATAEALAPLLKMESETILKLLERPH